MITGCQVRALPPFCLTVGLLSDGGSGPFLKTTLLAVCIEDYTKNSAYWASNNSQGILMTVDNLVSGVGLFVCYPEWSLLGFAAFQCSSCWGTLWFLGSDICHGFQEGTTLEGPTNSP